MRPQIDGFMLHKIPPKTGQSLTSFNIPNLTLDGGKTPTG